MGTRTSPEFPPVAGPQVPVGAGAQTESGCVWRWVRAASVGGSKSLWEDLHSFNIVPAPRTCLVHSWWYGSTKSLRKERMWEMKLRTPGAPLSMGKWPVSSSSKWKGLRGLGWEREDRLSCQKLRHQCRADKVTKGGGSQRQVRKTRWGRGTSALMRFASPGTCCLHTDLPFPMSRSLVYCPVGHLHFICFIQSPVCPSVYPSTHPETEWLEGKPMFSCPCFKTKGAETRTQVTGYTVSTSAWQRTVGESRTVSWRQAVLKAWKTELPGTGAMLILPLKLC